MHIWDVSDLLSVSFIYYILPCMHLRIARHTAAWLPVLLCRNYYITRLIKESLYFIVKNCYVKKVFLAAQKAFVIVCEQTEATFTMLSPTAWKLLKFCKTIITWLLLLTIAQLARVAVLFLKYFLIFAKQNNP